MTSRLIKKAFVLLAVIVAAGAAPAVKGAAPALNGQITLRPLTPSEIKD